MLMAFQRTQKATKGDDWMIVLHNRPHPKQLRGVWVKSNGTYITGRTVNWKHAKERHTRASIVSLLKTEAGLEPHQLAICKGTSKGMKVRFNPPDYSCPIH